MKIQAYSDTDGRFYHLDDDTLIILDPHLESGDLSLVKTGKFSGLLLRDYVSILNPKDVDIIKRCAKPPVIK